MRSTPFFPLLTAAILLPACTPAPPPSAPATAGGAVLAAELVEVIDSIARAAVEAGDVVGIAVAVSSGGHPVLVRGHGVADREAGTPVTESTVFRIGSIAKQITAAAVLRLEEEGRLSVDDPISRHLDDVPAEWGEATIHQLLNHTSGIPSYTDQAGFWEEATKRRTVGELVGLVRDLPLVFVPGTRWAYSNTGYLLLGSIIERVSGRSYGEYVEEELIRPLGLRETGACSESDPRLARGYHRGADGWVEARSNQIGGPFADGDICASARDLLRWTAALAAGRVVAPDAYHRMTTRGALLDGQEIYSGYGFDLLRLEGVGPVAEHGGAVPGFRSHLAHYPDQGVTIAVLTNAFEPIAHTAKASIERRLFAALLPAQLDLDLPTERVTVYSGTYDLYLAAANLGPFPMRIFESNGRLMGEADQTEFPLRWQGGDEFVDGMDLGLRLHFDVTGGRATRLVAERAGLRLDGARVEGR